MKLKLIRYHLTDNSTKGLLYVDGKFECYTLEDASREVKIPKVTSIPTGEYNILLKEVMTPKTISYIRRYPWFKFHFELQDVPNFKHIYIHVGNYISDTDGCILVGDGWNIDTLAYSNIAFKRLYKKMLKAYQEKEIITIEIIEIPENVK